MAGQIRIDLQLAAQTGPVNPQIMRVVDVAGTPDFTQQLAMRHYLAEIGEQQGEQFVFDRRQMDFRFTAPDLSLDEVDPNFAQGGLRAFAIRRAP